MFAPRRALCRVQRVHWVKHNQRVIDKQAGRSFVARARVVHGRSPDNARAIADRAKPTNAARKDLLRDLRGCVRGPREHGKTNRMSGRVPERFEVGEKADLGKRERAGHGAPASGGMSASISSIASPRASPMSLAYASPTARIAACSFGSASRYARIVSHSWLR